MVLEMVLYIFLLPNPWFGLASVSKVVPTGVSSCDREVGTLMRLVADPEKPVIWITTYII